MSDKARVLVVDDEEIVCVSVKRILSRDGYEVDTVQSSSQALEMLGQQEYALVITDLMMPEKNGIELMHAIKEKGYDPAFLMITGYPTIKTAMQALRLGAIDYIPKPFTRQELLSPVNRALRRQPREERASAPGPAHSGPIMPDDRFVLPEHAWAVYDQDGTLKVGIEKSFLDAAGRVIKIKTPEVNEMVEQGYPTIKLDTEDGGEHGVFMPFSGRVIAVNREVVDAPEKISDSEWIVQLIPSNLKAEVEVLIKQKSE